MYKYKPTGFYLSYNHLPEDPVASIILKNM